MGQLNGEASLGCGSLRLIFATVHGRGVVMSAENFSSGTPPVSVGIISASISRAAGGILPIMQAHAQELAKGGARVSVYGVADSFADADCSSWNPLIPRLHRPLVARFAIAPSLDRDLANAAHDVLHQHGLWLYPSIAVMRWRRRTGRPVVISTQGMLEPWALANANLKKEIAALLFERANLEAAACIHCSHAEAEGVRALGLTNPLAIIPNGAHLPDPKKYHARPTWLPDDARRTLLFLGRLHPKKGIRETLEAWARLKSLSPELAARWRLVVAGWDDGGHAEGFLAHAQSLGLPEVLFPGPVFGEEKDAAFAHADAFVLASHSEGLPIAVLEAWAHSLPVFMTRGCNIPEGFDEGAAVEIFTDPEALAHVLSNQLPAADLPAIGARGRELVATRFSWASIAADLRGVYEWLVRGAPPPDCVEVQ